MYPASMRLFRTAAFCKSMFGPRAAASDSIRTFFAGVYFCRSNCSSVTAGIRAAINPGSSHAEASQPAPRYLIFSRWKSGYRNKAGSKSAAEADEGSDDDDEPSEDDGAEAPLDVSRYAVPGWPANYKVVKHHLGTLRADAVLAAGLNVSRRKIEAEFLNSKLLVNGERLLKKSVQLRTGDYVDLVAEQLEGSTKVKRVKVIQVDEKLTSSGRTTVMLQAWRAAFDPATTNHLS